MPGLVSITLSDNRETTIGKALRSIVDFVDVCVLIDTGITDRTIKIAEEVCGEKLVVEQLRWPGRFDVARNKSLELSSKYGSWGMILDSDEWIEGDISSIGRTVDDAQDLYLLSSLDGSYCKEKVFRLPSKVCFIGPTHECPSKSTTKIIGGVVFGEAGKTEVDIIKKRQRDIKLLSDYLREHPKEPRWWYYLGDAQQGLAKYKLAIESYRYCVELRGWDEEAAWSFYRTAECHCIQNNFNEAIEACVLGLSRRADFPELAWLAGYSSYQAGNIAQAIRFSCMATDLGSYRGRSSISNRIGFRYLPAHFESPYDVLRYALVGEERKQAQAEYDKAIVARHTFEKKDSPSTSVDRGVLCQPES